MFAACGLIGGRSERRNSLICDTRIQPNRAREGQAWMIFDMYLRASGKVPCQSSSEKDDETPAISGNEADPRQGRGRTDVKVRQVKGDSEWVSGRARRPSPSSYEY